MNQDDRMFKQNPQECDPVITMHNGQYVWKLECRNSGFGNVGAVLKSDRKKSGQ